MKISKIVTAAIGGLAIVAVGSASVLAATPSKCSGGKIKNAGKKAAAKLTCLSKAVGKALAATDSTCIAKAEVKFSSAVAKAEAKIYTDAGCSATGDTASYESLVDATVADVGEELGFCASCCANTTLRLTTGVGAGNCGTITDAGG